MPNGRCCACGILNDANHCDVNLIDAILIGTDLSGADLSGADLSHAEISSTTFGNNDLRNVKGLNEIRHRGPSTIGIDTLQRSQGKIPEAFLRGCGVPDSWIEYLPS